MYVYLNFYLCCLYMYMCMSVYVCVYEYMTSSIYIYIYIERERERYAHAFVRIYKNAALRHYPLALFWSPKTARGAPARGQLS